MSDQPRRLTVREKQDLAPLVKAAQHHDAQSCAKWNEVGAMLDRLQSHGHSQCCPIGGMRAGARSGFSGVMPCPCGWDQPESAEDVLRRMIALMSSKPSLVEDQQVIDLVADALVVINRSPAQKGA